MCQKEVEEVGTAKLHLCVWRGREPASKQSQRIILICHIGNILALLQSFRNYLYHIMHILDVYENL